MGGNLLTTVQMRQINTWTGTPGQNWLLCYRRSTHGANSSTFHSRCDNKGPTVTVVQLNKGQSNARLIGGYASHSWNTNNSYFGNNTSFLFSLTNSYKHAHYRYTSYMYGNNAYGPTWGGGHDLYLGRYSTLGTGTYCNLGHNYQCRVGAYTSSQCRDDFCGTYTPVVNEIEVYYKAP